MSSTSSLASDVSMLPPLSSVRQDSDWEFDEAIREALGIGVIPEDQLQGIALKSGHPELLDHDYIKRKNYIIVLGISMILIVMK